MAFFVLSGRNQTESQPKPTYLIKSIRLKEEVLQNLGTFLFMAYEPDQAFDISQNESLVFCKASTTFGE